MEKLILICLVFCLSINLLIAQTRNNETTSKVISLEKLDLQQKTYLNDNGFPFSSYDLSNNEINLHLKESLYLRKSARTWTTIGLVGAEATTLIGVVSGFGVPLLLLDLGFTGSFIHGLIKGDKARQRVRNASIC